MSGLSGVSERKGLYLSVAGGYIWNRKAGESDPDYATQEYTKADKTTGVRSGARYADLTGLVTNVVFRTHEEYGESINVTVEAGEESFILSVSTNNRYSQDLMKALLKADLTKELFIKPYDFIGKDKKRAQGISFRQGGEKINLRVEGSPAHEKEWFKEASKKEIKRFFEDLSDWYVAEIEENVIPNMTADLPEDKPKSGLGSSTEDSESEDSGEEIEKKAEAPKKKVADKPKLTPIKMKKALKEYIAENYPDQTLPTLSKDQVIEWYNLSQDLEELPFQDDDAPEAEVNEEDLDKQLDALMP